METLIAILLLAVVLLTITAAIFITVVTCGWWSVVIFALVLSLILVDDSEAATYRYSPPARSYHPPARVQPRTVTQPKAPVVVNKTIVNKTVINRTTVNRTSPSVAHSASGGGFWSSLTGSFAGSMLGQWIFGLFGNHDPAPEPAPEQPTPQ